MKIAQLREIHRWAYQRLLENEQSLQSLYEYMKLIDALEAVIGYLEEEDANKHHSYLQIVDKNYRPADASNENIF